MSTPRITVELLQVADRVLTDAIYQARSAQASLKLERGMLGEPQRAISIAITEAETASLWLAKAIIEAGK